MLAGRPALLSWSWLAVVAVACCAEDGPHCCLLGVWRRRVGGGGGGGGVLCRGGRCHRCLHGERAGTGGGLSWGRTRLERGESALAKLGVSDLLVGGGGGGRGVAV